MFDDDEEEDDIFHTDEPYDPYEDPEPVDDGFSEEDWEREDDLNSR